MDEIGVIGVNSSGASAQWLAAIDAPVAASLVTAAADVALVIDPQGVIRQVSFGHDGAPIDGSDEWIGRHWLETVTIESRPKVLALLREATTSVPAQPTWRQVNHPGPAGVDVPVVYATVRIDATGGVLAVGRDLRAVSALQQRLVDAQQAMERDFQRLRQAEARYRLLFETVTEAVVVVDAASLAIAEANPAAFQVLGDPSRRLVGRPLPEAFEASCRAEAARQLGAARTAGRVDDIRVRLADGEEAVLSASVIRQESGTLLLVRLVSARTAQAVGEAGAVQGTWLRVVERVPDAFVVTDPQGRILAANAAFAELVQLSTAGAAVGQSLERWLGRGNVDLNVMAGTLRHAGVVRLFPTTVRAPYGAPADVEISGVAVPDGELPCFGFTIRDVQRRLPGEGKAVRELPRSAGQLAELVGRVPLRDIVSETTDMIERMCIEAALELTRDNRASAAEMLGLSRQSLYVKLRRYGLGDLGEPAAEPPPAN